MKKILLILSLAYFCNLSYAQWPTDATKNVKITPDNFDVYSNEHHVRSNGDSYYYFNGPKFGTTASFLQILDSRGVKKFPDSALLISKHPSRTWTMINQYMIIDADGNAIIAISDCRYAQGQEGSPTDYVTQKMGAFQLYSAGILAGSSSDLSYTIYKISPSGEFLWGENGISLQNEVSYGTVAAMNIIQLEDKSYVFCWMSSSSEDPIMQINLQKVSPSGALSWGAGKTLKDNAIQYIYPYMVNAGNNQMILVYAKGSNQDLYARKIDFDGESVWPEDTRIYRGGWGSVPMHLQVKVFPDNVGGALIAWYDDRLATNFESTYVAHIKSDGSHAYTSGEGGQKIGYSPNTRMFTPKAVYDQKNDCVYVGWRETTAGQGWQRIMAQKLNNNGELMYDPNGIEVSPWGGGQVQGPGVFLGPDNNFICFYLVRDSINIGYGKTKGWGALINGADGKFVWDFKYAAVNPDDTEKAAIWGSELVFPGQWICKWSDSRPNKAGIYAQNVRIDGTTGAYGISNQIIQDKSSKGFYVYPNPITTIANFLVQNEQKSNVSLKIYNAAGQLISTVFEGVMEVGNSELSWTPNNLAQGMYHAVLQQGNNTKSLKLILK